MAVLKTVVSTERIYVAVAFDKQIAFGHRKIQVNSLAPPTATPDLMAPPTATPDLTAPPTATPDLMAPPTSKPYDLSGVDVSSKTLESLLKCLQFSDNGCYLVVCGEDKKMTLFNTRDFSVTETRALPKRASSFCFTQDNETLLVADKSGEVNRYLLPELNAANHTLLIGHSSIVLDMTLLSHQDTNQRFLATCDRDEKIRISHYPNGYNIHCYCLHHTSFVSSICKVNKFPKYLISGGGDGLVCVWDWYNGEVLSIVNVNDQKQKDDKCDPSVVTALCEVSTNSKDNFVLIAVATNKYPGVFIYSLDNSGIITSTGLAISLSSPLWSMDCDQLGRLWVCLNNKDAPVNCYRCTIDQITQVTDSEEPLLSLFNKLSIAEDAHGCETNWSEFRKRDFDNMSIYLSKKEERIQLKTGERDEMVTNLEDIIQETEVQDDNPKQSKIIKLDESGM